jgi:BMFP domain-containing protein YqiC
MTTKNQNFTGHFAVVARERAEIARLNMRITDLEVRLDSFIGIVNEVRETYNPL